MAQSNTSASPQASQPQATGQQQQSSGQTGGSTADREQSTQTGQAMDGARSAELQITQDKVVDTLTKAGLKEINVIDAAYLVQAQTPEGAPVVLVVNSDGVPMSQVQPAAQPGGGQMGGSQADGTQSGQMPKAADGSSSKDGTSSRSAD